MAKNDKTNMFKLSLYYENVRSIVNKRKDILLSTSECIYDAIMLTETWLHNGHYDGEFFCDKYRIFRKDRISSNIKNVRGGGVLIAVNNKFNCDNIEFDEIKDLEAICVKISTNNQFIYLYCGVV